jgi:hypothetical protein
MNITDELQRLATLHRNGDITDAEFAEAKQHLLAPPAVHSFEPNNTVGRAANRFVSFQIVMAAIGLVIFLVLFFTTLRPYYRAVHRIMDPLQSEPPNPNELNR